MPNKSQFIEKQKKNLISDNGYHYQKKRKFVLNGVKNAKSRHTTKTVFVKIIKLKNRENDHLKCAKKRTLSIKCALHDPQ